MLYISEVFHLLSPPEMFQLMNAIYNHVKVSHTSTCITAVGNSSSCVLASFGSRPGYSQFRGEPPAIHCYTQDGAKNSRSKIRTTVHQVLP